MTDDILLFDLTDFYPYHNRLPILHSFIGFGVTCGPIGYKKLIESSWYIDNEEKILSFIKDPQTEDQIKVFMIPSTLKQSTWTEIPSDSNYFVTEEPYILPWEPETLGTEVNIKLADLEFLRKMISEASNSNKMVTPKWWLFGYDQYKLRRIEFVNTPDYNTTLSQNLENFLIKDVIKNIVMPYCQMDPDNINDLLNY